MPNYPQTDAEGDDDSFYPSPRREPSSEDRTPTPERSVHKRKPQEIEAQAKLDELEDRRKARKRRAANEVAAEKRLQERHDAEMELLKRKVIEQAPAAEQPKGNQLGNPLPALSGIVDIPFSLTIGLVGVQPYFMEKKETQKLETAERLHVIVSCLAVFSHSSRGSVAQGTSCP